MTAQTLALRGALCYSGITSLTDEDNESAELTRGKSPAIIADVAAEINAAIQTLARNASHLFKSNGGGILLAPVNATGITATQGSTTISGFSAYTAAMRGCTIRLSGDGYDNEVRSATELARPYLGTTGSGISATIYFDCIPLATTIGQVIEPVMIPGIGVVHLANSREEFLTGAFIGPNQRGTYANSFPYSANYTKQVGRPIRWMCEEGDYDPLNPATVLLLRFYPMPNAIYGVSFQQTLKPPTYTEADVDNDDGGADPAVVIPFPWVESTLLPMLKKRWMAHPTFNKPEAAQEIQMQYQEAMANLEHEKPVRGYRVAAYSNR